MEKAKWISFQKGYNPTAAYFTLFASCHMTILFTWKPVVATLASDNLSELA
jgi:hypothetical protein